MGRVALVCLVFVSIAGRAQSPAADGEQIAALLDELSTGSRSPDALLDPMLNAGDRANQLRPFSRAYSLRLTREGDITISGRTASAPVRVEYAAGEGNSLNASATVRFVQRDGHWYYADYEFMNWPIGLIVVVVVCVAAGVVYASTVLTLRRRLLKRGLLNVGSASRLFIPFFWPTLYRQSR